MDIEGLYKSRIEIKNKIAVKTLQIQDLELNLESVELEITEKELSNGQEIS